MANTKAKSWKDGNLEKILEKDKNCLERCYGKMDLLKKLRDLQAIPEEVHSTEIEDIKKVVSEFAESNISTDIDIDEVLIFWCVKDNAISKAKMISGVFLFTNVLLIMAIALIVIAIGSALTIFIVPLLEHCSETI